MSISFMVFTGLYTFQDFGTILTCTVCRVRPPTIRLVLWEVTGSKLCVTRVAHQKGPSSSPWAGVGSGRTTHARCTLWGRGGGSVPIGPGGRWIQVCA